MISRFMVILSVLIWPIDAQIRIALPSSQQTRRFSSFPMFPTTRIALPLTSSNNSNHAIVFKMKTDPAMKSFRTNRPPRCVDQDGFCEDDPDYSDVVSKRFEDLMRKSHINDFIADVLVETLESPPVGLRSGFSTEQPVCDATETIIYPKRGKTPNNDFVFILNQGTVRQGIRVEKCLNVRSPCRLGRDVEGTKCDQKFIYKKLLTMDDAGNNIVAESVYLPSCCVCYVRSNFIAERSGLRTRP